MTDKRKMDPIANAGSPVIRYYNYERIDLRLQGSSRFGIGDETNVHDAAKMSQSICLPAFPSVAHMTDALAFEVCVVSSTDVPTGTGDPGLLLLAPEFANANAQLAGAPLCAL